MIGSRGSQETFIFPDGKIHLVRWKSSRRMKNRPAHAGRDGGGDQRQTVRENPGGSASGRWHGAARRARFETGQAFQTGLGPGPEKRLEIGAVVTLLRK